MSTLPLVPKQMDALLQAITLSMTSLTLAPSTTSPNYYAVRLGWQQQGQPAQKITEDIIYIRAIEVDDQYNRVRDVVYSGNGTTETTNYTRVWEVYWTIYGPSSFDNARIVRSSLFNQAIHDLFANSQLYLITDPQAPRRMPEQFAGQSWERVDFSAKFNEFVTEVNIVQTVAISEIILENSSGVIADIEVT